MSVPSGAARRHRRDRSVFLTNRELAVVAEYERHLAAGDPELVARLELLWALAAPSPPDHSEGGPGSRRLAPLLTALAAVGALTVVLAALALIAMVSMQVMVEISHAAGAL